MRKFVFASILGITALCYSSTTRAEMITITVGFEQFAQHIGPNDSWSSADQFPSDVVPERETVWNDAWWSWDTKTTFTIDGVSFHNYSGESLGMNYWSGAGLSTKTDTTNPGFTNDMVSITGSGANGSDTYGIIYGSSVVGLEWNDKTLPVIAFSVPGGVDLQSMMITNTTYTADVMRWGDGYADGGGWLNLWIYGISGDELVAQTNILLGEDDRILDDWHEVVFGNEWFGITELRFAFDSNEFSDWGLNYPTYFAFDNIVYQYWADETIVPEPATLAIIGLGLIGLGIAQRWRK